MKENPYVILRFKKSIILYGFKFFMQKIMVSPKISNIAVTRCDLIKKVFQVLNHFCGNRFCNFYGKPINLLIFHLKPF